MVLAKSVRPELGEAAFWLPERSVPEHLWARVPSSSERCRSLSALAGADPPAPRQCKRVVAEFCEPSAITAAAAR
eukprot:2320000-Alexandrium_andersonii.AAC.1